MPFRLCLAGAIGLFAAASGSAAEDPPLRVGNLNYLSGEVSWAHRGEQEEAGGNGSRQWAVADFNQPVCQDMSLRTGALARARIRIGPDAIQMSSDTVLNVLNLSDGLIEASIERGRVHLQLAKLREGETAELELPRGSLWLLQSGAYDVEVGTADQPARIVVFEGKARFVGGNADIPIGAGEQAEVTGAYPAVTTSKRPIAEPGSVARPVGAPPVGAPPTGAPATPDDRNAAQPAAPGQAVTAAGFADAPPEPPAAGSGQKSPDDFSFWVKESQDVPDARQAARYVSDETTGFDGLDRYGKWQTLPDSQAAWFPADVPPDWAPYRFGHWASIPPWGWTWIDDQPWGFAPFHYGRWVNVDGRWGWVPGEKTPDPVYAPALVAFVDTSGEPGYDPNAGPPVAWFPLGPGDAYVPWYDAGPAYVERINVVNRLSVDRVAARGGLPLAREAWRARYFNRRFATAVPREAFAGARAVGRETMRLSPGRLEQAPVMRGAPRVMPAASRTAPRLGEAHAEPHGAAPVAMRPGGGPVEHAPGGARWPGARGSARRPRRCTRAGARSSTRPAAPRWPGARGSAASVRQATPPGRPRATPSRNLRPAGFTARRPRSRRWAIAAARSNSASNSGGRK